MALIVEDGTGLANAESYISVADATTYLDNYHDSDDLTVWSAATTTNQEKALRRATRYIETRYGNRLDGSRLNTTQSLALPRSSFTDPDGNVVSGVPTPFKHATAELALRAVSGDLQPDVSNPGTIRRQYDRVGNLETETEYASPASQLAAYTLIDDMLRGWFRGGVSLERS